MKRNKFLIALAISLVAWNGLQAQQQAAYTVEEQAQLDSIKQFYLNGGVSEESAAKRALTVFKSKKEAVTRSVSRNPIPAPGSIWLDRDATGADYNDYHYYTPEEFVKKVFVKNSSQIGAEIDEVIKNVKFTGVGWDESTQTWTNDDRSLHYFDHGDVTSKVKSYDGITEVPRFGIENGFLLATGGGLLTEGLNQMTNGLDGGVVTTNVGGTVAPDADLQSTITQILGTQTILEFDFMPYVDSVSFKFVFASTEFKNYSNSDYNDAFGFFITGPDLQDAWGNTGTTINIARYPNGAPIVVNTSNWGERGNNRFEAYDHLGPSPVVTGIVPPRYNAVSPDYHLPIYSTGYTNRGGVASYQDCDSSLMEYDGHSILLTAKAKLKRGEWYHMKLAIGNARDGSLGSGTYIMAGSFNLGAPKSTMPRPYALTPYDTVYGWNSLYANCDYRTELTFPSSPTAQTIYIWSEGSGADFIYDAQSNKYFKDSVKYIIPANDSVMTVKFKVDDQVKNNTQVRLYTMIESGSTDTTEIFDLYAKSKTEIEKYIYPTVSYAGMLDVLTTNGSPYILRSVNAGATWEFARDTLTGEMKPFTKSQIANLTDDDEAYIIYREPNTCCTEDTLFISKYIGQPTIQRVVTMPAISGAICSIGPGEHMVNSRDDFTFTITPSGNNTGMFLKITTSRTTVPDAEGVVIVQNVDGSYTVTIRRIQEPILISVDFVTSNATIENNKIWTNGSQVYIQSNQAEQAQIYTISSVLIQNVNLIAGETANIPLPKGFYIITIDDLTYKVIVK